MPKIQVVKREVVKVDFGKIGDPQRIAKIVGNLTHYYDPELDPSRFEPAPSDPEPWRSREGLSAWPEGMVEREVAVIKPNIYFPNYAALKGYVDELTDFEHLLFPFLTCVKPWAPELYKKGVFWVPATDPNSLRRRSDGGLGVPCSGCRPGRRGRAPRWLRDGWRGDAGVLVACK